MSADLVQFHFDAHEVRVQVDERGNPWWVAKDVCDILGLQNPTAQLRKLRPQEKTLTRIEGIHNPQGVNLINEPGLYRLLMRSDKPEAERFQDWVVQEVLPTIRQTGQYAVAAPSSTALDRFPELRAIVELAQSTAEARLLAEEAKSEAAQANANAARALDSQLFFTVAEYTCFNHLQRQIPASAYKACSDHLRLYCMDNAIPFRKIFVGSRQWEDEYGFHVSVYTEALPGWLKRRYAQTDLHVIHTRAGD